MQTGLYQEPSPHNKGGIQMDKWKAMRAAEDKYLELRDAKSNGCLGFNPSILQVLAYDRKIEAAYAEYEKAKKEWAEELK